MYSRALLMIRQGKYVLSIGSKPHNRDLMKLSYKIKVIRNSGRNQSQFAEKAFFWFSPEFGGKILKFRAKIQANCGEDLFYVELTRPFILRTLCKLLEGTLTETEIYLHIDNIIIMEGCNNN